MELNVIEQSKGKLIFELKVEDHGFCNVLKDELNKDKHVKGATYNIEHPLVSEPRFVVETDGADPKKVLTDAAKRLSKTVDKFKTQYKKEVK